METEEILTKVKNADMILVGLGEDFDDNMRLQECPEYKNGRNLLQDADLHWLLPAWNEYCSEKLEDIVSPALKKLAGLLENKNYFIVSIAADSRIPAMGWKENRLVMPCGMTFRKQCLKGCGHGVELMQEDERKRMEVFFDRLYTGVFSENEIAMPDRCPQCGGPMILNNIFAENYDENGYIALWKLYTKWLQGTLNHRLLLLELGVGMQFPTVIRWPFEKIAFFNNKAFFVRVHEKLYQLTAELSGKGVGIQKNAIAWLQTL